MTLQMYFTPSSPDFGNRKQCPTDSVHLESKRENEKGCCSIHALPNDIP